MAIRSIQRRKTLIGYATPDEAPIYVDSDDNILKFIPAGSGSTEVQIVDVSSTQTLSNKTIAAPVFTGQLQLADGTAAAPSLTFATHTTDGVYSDGLQQVGIATNGVARLFIGNALVQIGSGTTIGWSSNAAANSGTADVRLYRSAAKTLTIDTDGAGGALTLFNVVGSSQFNGAMSVINAGVNIGASSVYGWSNRSDLLSPADGIIQATNNAGTGFTRLILGTNDATVNGFSFVNSGGTVLVSTGDGSVLSGIRADQLQAGPGKFIANNTGKVTTYNNVATAGLGVSTVYGSAITATQTANVTILSYTPPATAGRYKVYGVVTTTSSTNTGTVQLTVDYVDSQGTVHTGDIIPLVDASGVVATTKSGASKEYHGIPWLISINNAGTAIVVKCVITGSVSYTGEAIIEQVA